MKRKIFISISIALAAVAFLFVKNHQKLSRYILITAINTPNHLHTEVDDLLGAQEEKNYLIALMNTSEARPNGGFFGSYAIVQLTPKGYGIEFFDSYYPQSIQKTTHSGSSWLTAAGLKQQREFVAGNIYGFTEQDGAVIADTYQQTFDMSLDGVVFLDYKIFQHSIPDFWNWTYTQEFMNATTPLREGSLNKDQYLSILQNITNNPRKIIAKTAIHHSKIKHQEHINIYLPTASTGLQTWLTSAGLHEERDANILYLWELNLGFNKINKFLSQEATLVHNDNIITTTKDRIHHLTTGDYTLTLTHTLDIPIEYQNTIADLIEKHNITLTDREQKILSLDEQWHQKQFIYLPNSCNNVARTGDLFESYFNSDQCLLIYSIVGEGNGSQNTATITFTLGQ